MTLDDDTGPIDCVHLERQTLGDASLQRELLGLLDGQIRRFAGRLASGADDEARQIAHALKGAASAVGAFALAAAAARCELEPTAPKRRRDLEAEMSLVSAFIGSLGA